MTKGYMGDPLVRIMLVIILGTIALGLLFSMLTGGGTMDHMGGMGGYGYGGSLDTFLGGLLILLVKLLLVVLVIAVVVGIAAWIWNTFFKNTNLQFVQAIKNDPVLKTISTVTLAIIGIVLLFALLGSLTGAGAGVSSGIHGYGAMGGFNPALSIAGLLNLLIKVLSFVLVISLILALLAFLKKQYDAGVFNFMKGGTQGNAAGAGTNSPPAGDSNENIIR